MNIFHIRRGLYLGSVKTTSLRDVKAALRLDSLPDLGWPSEIEVLQMPEVVERGLSRHLFDRGTAFMQHHLNEGHPLLVSCADGSNYTVAFVLAHLMEYEKLSLPQAFLWLGMRYPHLYPKPKTLYELVLAFDLPYTRDEALSASFPSVLMTAALREISPVMEGLYISGVAAMQRAEELRALNIGAVVRLDRADRAAGQWPQDFALLDTPIMDRTAVHPMILEQTTAFIHRQREAGKNVLIHCQMGVSRAATVTLAYLIQYEQKSLAEAYKLLCAARPFVYPNSLLLESLVNHYHLPYTPDEIIHPFFLDDLLAS
jgi:protein-tyrosine phosphatase